MTPARYLLDTNIVIEGLRRPSSNLQRRFNAQAAALATSTVVLHELHYGADRAQNPLRARAQVEALAALVQVREFDTKAAEHAADIRAALAARGTPIRPFDVLIAGQARSSGLVVVTNNVREFARVEGLRVEDWTVDI